jgi:hypothetical protein
MFSLFTSVAAESTGEREASRCRSGQGTVEVMNCMNFQIMPPVVTATVVIVVVITKEFDFDDNFFILMIKLGA